MAATRDEQGPSEECLDGLAARSLGHVVEYAPAVTRAIARTAALLRDGDIAAANDLYAQLLDALSVLVFTVESAAGYLGSEGQALRAPGAGMLAGLGELEAAQRREDWIHVADVLQHVIAPIVARWSADAIQLVSANPAPDGGAVRG
jgi:hypothetical protein